MRAITFIAVLIALLSVTVVAVPLASEAQQAAKVVRIGLLDYAASDPAGAARWKAFRERLRELGYVEGRNGVVEARWGDGHVTGFETWPPS